MSILMLRPAFATFRPRNSVAERGPAAFARRIDILRSLADVEAIEGEWRALEAATPETTGFQSFDWCRAWMRADAGGRDRWRIVAVRDSGRLVALWPLERQRLLGARVLRWLGEPWTQYGDVLVADDRARLEHLAAGWREIASWTDIDLVKLGRVRVDSALSALPGLSGRTIVHREEAPFIDFRKRTAGPGKGLRARRRKLEAMGTVRFDIVAEPAARRDSVARAVAFKTAWLRSRGLASSGLSHAGLDALMASLAGTGSLVIGRLRVGEEVAALELGIRANRTFRSLLGSHDERFTQGSPGHQLIGHMVDWCRAEGLAAYDLMVPADAYKRQWANDQMVVQDHLVSMRWRGRIAGIWYAGRPGLKHIYRRLPAWCRYLLAPGLPGRR